jgi:predicted tellurium resistance membrane protein TerC
VHVRKGATLKEAIGIIILADVVMSFDNVMAISGVARGDLLLVVFGLLLSLPLVVWGSGLLARLMDRFPLIIWLGGGVLGWVAVEMMFDDPLIVEWLGEALAEALHRFAPWCLGAVIALMGWWFARNLPRTKDAA